MKRGSSILPFASPWSALSWILSEVRNLQSRLSLKNSVSCLSQALSSFSSWSSIFVWRRSLPVPPRPEILTGWFSKGSKDGHLDISENNFSKFGWERSRKTNKQNNKKSSQTQHWKLNPHRLLTPFIPRQEFKGCFLIKLIDWFDPKDPFS